MGFFIGLEILFEISILVLGVILLLSQVIYPMFSDKELFWFFRKSKEVSNNRLSPLRR
jgi:hypothetical protein